MIPHMSEHCPACGRLRVPSGSMYIGTSAICLCNTAQAFGTFFAAPYRTPEQIAVDAAERASRPTYAEHRADQLLGNWRSYGELTFDRLRALIIEALEEYDE